MFCFRDPWARELACKLQTAERAIFMNRDS